jgi:hypothetical protein
MDIALIEREKVIQKAINNQVDNGCLLTPAEIENKVVNMINLEGI